MSLTKVAPSMIDGQNAEVEDVIKFDGESFNPQKDTDSNTDRFVNGGRYDPEAGILTLLLRDELGNDVTSVNIEGFMTPSNIGVGAEGPTGSDGADGVPGQDGSDGKDGEQGCIGPCGNDGPIGATGPIGETGETGPIGETGEIGEVGPEGPKGEPGDSPILDIGDEGSSEVSTSGRAMQWGTIDSLSDTTVFRVYFPEAFQVSPTYISIEWIDESTSYVAGDTRISDIQPGFFELTVIAGRLNGEPATGWNFMWKAMGV